MLATGEPVESWRDVLHREPRPYGSRVLLGPRTFGLTSKILVARPIDFLSWVGVAASDVRFTNPLLALEASRDQITRFFSCASEKYRGSSRSDSM